MTQIFTEIRGRRVMVEIIPGGKRKYFYYQCPKCGADKNLKSSYCPDCQRISTKKHTIKVKKHKEIEIDSEVIGSDFSKADSTLENYLNHSDIINEKINLINWVNKIERRGGLASMEDIFVHMIGFYNYFGKEGVIDTLPTSKQLEIMWDFVRGRRDEFSKQELKVLKKKESSRSPQYLKYQRDYSKCWRMWKSGLISKEEFDRIKPIKERENVNSETLEGTSSSIV